MKKCGRVLVYVHKFTLAVGGVGWSASLLWLLSLGNSYLPFDGTVDSWSLHRKKLDQNKNKRKHYFGYFSPLWVSERTQEAGKCVK
jgi:hypothetical protein